MKRYWLIYSVLFLCIEGLLYISYAHADFQISAVDFRFLLLLNLVFYLLGLSIAFLHKKYARNFQPQRHILQEIYLITFVRVVVIGGASIAYWLLQKHKITLENTLLGFSLYFVYTFAEKYLQIKSLRSRAKT